MGYHWVTQASATSSRSASARRCRRSTSASSWCASTSSAATTPSTARHEEAHITFGKGGVDDAEDAEVIVHEYGHSVQDDQVPGFGPRLEAGSIGEAFGDYLAVTVTPRSRTRRRSRSPAWRLGLDLLHGRADALPAPARRHQALPRGPRGRGARRRRDLVGGAVARAQAHRQHDPHGQGDHRRAVRLQAGHLVPPPPPSRRSRPPRDTESRTSSGRRSPSAASSARRSRVSTEAGVRAAPYGAEPPARITVGSPATSRRTPWNPSPPSQAGPSA